MDNSAGIDASDKTGSSEKPTAIGIDLGTTYSCVAVFQYGMVEIIEDGQGQRTIPSFVAFNENERLFGTAAKNQAGLNSLNTVYDVKRLIGRRFDDPAIQEDIRTYPFEVINEKGLPKVKVEFMEKTVTFTPEEISAMILGHMKSIAEKYLEYEIKDAVVTVPAYFDNSQREATKNAGKIAGLNVLRIINEPTAAAVAYGLDKKTEGEKNVLIYDFGGGTFDVSIMTFDNGTCEVKATAGNTHLGGEDFDNLMVKHFLDEILKTHKKNLKSDKKAIRRLKTECEKAKHRLSTLTTASVEVDRLFDGIDFHSEITRTKFVKMCDDFFQETLGTVEKTLEAAEMEKSEIDEIILVGGSTRIPRIQSLLKDYFNKTDLDIVVNPDEAVAYGAAIQAAILSGVDMEMLQDLLLLDVTPLSLGIQTHGGKMTNLINRNTTIPTREMKYFSTSCDNQTSVMIKVFQGERLLTNDNKMLGRFQLKDIQKAPKKYPKIEVTFDIDTDGILNVSAVDKNTGNQNKITIAKSKEGLNEEEIEKMVQEAKESRAIDEQNLTRINATIDLQNYAKQLRSIVKLEKFNLLMSDSDRKKVEEKIEETISSIQNNVYAKISDLESMRQELDAVCTPVMEKYKRASDLHDNVEDEDNSRPGNQFEELN